MASKARRQQQPPSTTTSATKPVSEFRKVYLQQVDKQQSAANFRRINSIDPTQTYWKLELGFGDVKRGTGWFEPGSQHGYRTHHSPTVQAKLVSESKRVLPVQVKGSGTGVFLPRVSNKINDVSKKNIVKSGEPKKKKKQGPEEDQVGKQDKENTFHPSPELNLPPEWTY